MPVEIGGGSFGVGLQALEQRHLQEQLALQYAQLQQKREAEQNAMLTTASANKAGVDRTRLELAAQLQQHQNQLQQQNVFHGDQVAHEQAALRQQDQLRHDAIAARNQQIQDQIAGRSDLAASNNTAHEQRLQEILAQRESGKAMQQDSAKQRLAEIKAREAAAVSTRAFNAARMQGASDEQAQQIAGQVATQHSRAFDAANGTQATSPTPDASADKALAPFGDTSMDEDAPPLQSTNEQPASSSAEEDDSIPPLATPLAEDKPAPDDDEDDAMLRKDTLPDGEEAPTGAGPIPGATTMNSQNGLADEDPTPNSYVPPLEPKIPDTSDEFDEPLPMESSGMAKPNTPQPTDDDGFADDSLPNDTPPAPTSTAAAPNSNPNSNPKPSVGTSAPTGDFYQDKASAKSIFKQNSADLKQQQEQRKEANDVIAHKLAMAKFEDHQQAVKQKATELQSSVNFAKRAADKAITNGQNPHDVIDALQTRARGELNEEDMDNPIIKAELATLKTEEAQQVKEDRLGGAVNATARRPITLWREAHPKDAAHAKERQNALEALRAQYPTRESFQGRVAQQSNTTPPPTPKVTAPESGAAPVTSDLTPAQQSRVQKYVDAGWRADKAEAEVRAGR